MHASLNRVTLLGEVARYGMEVRYNPGGTPCASFTLIVSEQGQDGKVHDIYIPCECWGKKAAAAGELDTGALVLFEGKLRKRQKGDTWEMVVSGSQVQPLVLGSLVTETAGLRHPAVCASAPWGHDRAMDCRESPRIAQRLGRQKKEGHMFLPTMPVWCWNLLGEDHVRLAQPTHDQVGLHTRFFPPDTCVARCQYETWVIDPADDTRSFPFVCGHVGILVADGAYLCRLHSAYHRLGCAWCEEYAARGEPRACPGCHALWRDIGAPCWCCPSGTEAQGP